MATFSTSQARHLYVVGEVSNNPIVPGDNAGAVYVGKDTVSNAVYLQYKSPGGVVRSDMISISNLTYAKAIDAADMKYTLDRYKVVLDSSVNSGAPIIGQDYLLRITIKSHIGPSDEYQYFKFGSVRVVAGMTASTFYKTMALSLAINFKREPSKMFNFYLETGGTVPGTIATTVAVTDATDPDSLTGTYTGIVIEEVEQPWVLGKFQQTPLHFNIQPDRVTDSGDERIWGLVNKGSSSASVHNGKKTADLEHFTLGERGDVYRGAGYPNNIDSTYLVNPSNEYNYIELGYFWAGGAEEIQKSPRTITLVVPKVGSDDSVSNVLANSLITKLNTALGTSITALNIT